jgi:hypothetical protein
VSWNLNKTHYGDAPRSTSFTTDVTLPTGCLRITTSDYTNSGYSRGHMVASEERTWSIDDNKATFQMTNILPQYQDLNGGPWARFEQYLQSLAQTQDKELYVIAGGTGNRGTLNNAGKVQIPTYTYKIVVVMPYGQGLANATTTGSIQVIAVDMPNVTGISTQPLDRLQDHGRRAGGLHRLQLPRQAPRRRRELLGSARLLSHRPHVRPWKMNVGPCSLFLESTGRSRKHQRQEVRRLGVSPASGGRAARAVGHDTPVPNCAKPRRAHRSTRSLHGGAGAPGLCPPGAHPSRNGNGDTSPPRQAERRASLRSPALSRGAAPRARMARSARRAIHPSPPSRP